LPGLANNADGMAFDGTYLWVAAEDGSDAYLHKVNVITNQVDASVALSTTFRFPQSVTFDGTLYLGDAYGFVPILEYRYSG
jgi:hypothetical protein